MTNRRICFVTDELYPFTGGGIGRILHNIVKAGLKRDPTLKVHFLFPERVPIEPQRVEAHFGGSVSASSARSRPEGESTYSEHGIYPPPEAHPSTPWQAQSLDMMLALVDLERVGAQFDVIEFTDYRGWALASLNEKRLGLAFQNTLLTVRLHSSDGVLMHYEPRQLTFEQVTLLDQERKALLDADQVIAHLEPIAEFNREYYGFDAEWRSRVIVEFPPVVWPEPTLPHHRATRPRDLVFATRLVPFKGPELFIRGAVAFMHAHPEFEGRAILACIHFDERYRESLQDLVPADLKHRFLFLQKASPSERESILDNGIVVVPSSYESLNLAAYESSVAGRRLVLNGRCLAFGETSPFVDGVNCHKFDGTVGDLSTALERAWGGPPLEPVRWHCSPPYWEAETRPPEVRAQPVRVSAIIVNRNACLRLPETLRSLADDDGLDLEVMLVDSASDSAFDRDVLERIERDGQSVDERPVKLLRLPVERGLAGAANAGVRAACGDLVVVLLPGDALAPGFLQSAIAAMRREPQVTAVVPTSGVYSEEAELRERRFLGFRTFLGDAPSLALISDRTGGGPALIRRSVLAATPFDEELSGAEDACLYMRLALAGHRWIVTNNVQAFRHRSNLPPQMPAGQWLAVRSRAYEGLLHPLNPAVRLFALLVPAAQFLRQQQSERETAPDTVSLPLRYRLFDRMNDRFKGRFPSAHRALKRLLWFGEAGDLRPLRHRLADRLNAVAKPLGPIHRRFKRAAQNRFGQRSAAR